jgi:hypothetical protein
MSKAKAIAIRIEPPEDDAGNTTKHDAPTQYIWMRFVPEQVATNIYLAFTDGIEVRPPSFRHKRTYPKFQDLKPGTGVAVTRSPRTRVYPYFALQFLFVIFFLRELFGDGGWVTLAALVLALLNLVVVWFAYLSWASNVLVVTPAAIYRYSGMYASQPASFQGADIEKVMVHNRTPKDFWKLLGFGGVDVSFGDGKKTIWKIHGIGNAEAVAALIRGLQRAYEKAITDVPGLLEQILTVQQEQLEAIQGMRDDLRGQVAPNQHEELGTALERSTQASSALLEHLQAVKADPPAQPGGSQDQTE